jgi:hypothetical protein
MFIVDLLPAAEGDCIWIEYGTAAERHRILIDGGPLNTYDALRTRIKALPAGKRHFDLFVITHIDADHIGGCVALLADTSLGVTFGDVWFNGWRHLIPDQLGPTQAEMLSTLLEEREDPWNLAFGGKAVSVGTGELPHKRLPGGMQLTLLSPTPVALERLIPIWDRAVRKAGLVPGVPVPEDFRRWREYEPDELGGPSVEELAAHPFRRDGSLPNRASISFLAEYGGAAAILTGDAHADLIVGSLRRLLEGRRLRRLPLAALKVSHHGSRANTSRELLTLIDTPSFLISTSSAKFGHPDPEAIARIVTSTQDTKPPTLWFNYAVPSTTHWDDAALKADHQYAVKLPFDVPGMRIKLA